MQGASIGPIPNPQKAPPLKQTFWIGVFTGLTREVLGHSTRALNDIFAKSRK